MATYRHWSVSLWQDPDNVSHCRILSSDKTEWRIIPAALCRWRCCFLVDQLSFMTCIREEDRINCFATNQYSINQSINTPCCASVTIDDYFYWQLIIVCTMKQIKGRNLVGPVTNDDIFDWQLSEDEWNNSLSVSAHQLQQHVTLLQHQLPNQSNIPLIIVTITTTSSLWSYNLWRDKNMYIIIIIITIFLRPTSTKHFIIIIIFLFLFIFFDPYYYYLLLLLLLLLIFFFSYACHKP